MKFVKIAGVATVVIIALAVLGVTLTFAQNPTPTDTPWWNAMRNMMQSNGAAGKGGWGMMGGNWESMQQMHEQMTQNGGWGAMQGWMRQYGVGGMHETVWKALAEQLGLTPEELTAQVTGGKTLAQIAQEKGVSTKDLAAAMENGMKAGLAQAVKDGKLTQEQADLMLQNMSGRYEWMITNMGAGMMGPGGGGCHDFDRTPADNTSL